MAGSKDDPAQGESLFARPPSFMGVPFSKDLSRSKAAVLGIPFDCGTHPVRIGARYGPSAIREQSRLVRPYQPPHADFDPLARLGVVDCGDVNLVPSVIEESFERIEAAVRGIVEAGAMPVTMGGDGSVTLPQLRALHRRYSDLVVLHIDAHTDTYPGEGDCRARYNTGTTFTRAAEEGLIDVAHSIHLGARGTLAAPDLLAHTRRQGYELIEDLELRRMGLDAALAHVHERLRGRPVYLCFDMDFFDPSCAPGVCTPSWGGASAREGLDLLRGLAGLDFVAFDVNTVSPPHDQGGMTAFLAATVMITFLAMV